MKKLRYLFSFYAGLAALLGGQSSWAAGDGATQVVELVCTAGGITEHALGVMPGKKLFVQAVVGGRMAAYDLIDKQGRSVVPIGRRRVYVEQYVCEEQYTVEVHNENDGLRVVLIGDITADASLKMVLVSENQPRLEARVTPEGLKVGQAALMTAAVKIGDAIVRSSDMECEAEITLPKGKRHRVLLRDDGTNGDKAADDGVFSLAVEPAQKGIHQFHFNMRWSVDGEVMKLDSGCAAFASADVGARFTGIPKFRLAERGPDEAIGGVYIAFDLWLPRGSRVEVHARVEAKNGETIHPDLHVTVMNGSQEGSQSIDMTLRGEQIVRTGEDGPWRVTDIRLWDLDRNRCVDVGADVLTPSYSAGKFQKPDAPQIASASRSEDGQEIVIEGRNVGDVVELSIDGQTFPFRSRSRNSVVVLRPRQMSEEKWANVKEDIGAKEIRISTPWGQATLKPAASWQRGILGREGCQVGLNCTCVHGWPR